MGYFAPAQKRALFYVFDGGTGIGHLRRMACLAQRLQGPFACLVVTGHRAAANWFVPNECEYVHLPAWDALLEHKARYWGRKPFLSSNLQTAVQFRRQILHGVVRGFRPDAIFVDHLPLGMEEELEPIIRTSQCRKYLVTRGVLNETEDLRRLILGGRANEYLEHYYHRVFAAVDPRVLDFSRQYNLSAGIREKTVHTGYVTRLIAREEIAETRAARGLRDGDRWVVVSAGGGQLGERLIEAGLALADTHAKSIAFDIVLGPRSRLSWSGDRDAMIERDRLRIHREVPDLSSMNASADVVVSSGGYNTVLEALQGQGVILAFPFRLNQRDEQYQHALRLKRFTNIQVSMDINELPKAFELALATVGRRDRRGELDVTGATTIERIVREDFGLGTASACSTGTHDGTGGTGK